MLQVDYPGIVQQYRAAMATARQVPGREGLSYTPLGEHELKAMSRAYKCRIQVFFFLECRGMLMTLFVVWYQVIKNDSLTPEVFARPIDPRTIPPKLIHDINPSARRIVRLLNVNTNHYQIHLPKAA